MTLEDIQKAVAALTPDDVARFRTWFEQFDAFHFKKTESDGAADRPESVTGEALADTGDGSMPRLISSD